MKKISHLSAVAALALLPLTLQAVPAESLREAVQRAVVSNPEVQARWHAYLAAEEEQDVARGGYFPRVDLTASIGRERQSDPGIADRNYSRRGATLSLNQMVYDGFATQSEVARLGHAKLTRYFEILDASESVAGETVRAYADVLRYRDLVQLAQENFLRHKEVFDQIEERASAGVGRRVDLEQAGGRLALAESNLLTEASNLHDVSSRYQRLVGELPGDALQPIGRLAEQLPPSVADALRLAYEGHPAFHAAVESVRAATEEAKGKEAAYQPRVDLRARQSVDYNTDGDVGRHGDSVVELVMNFNLFNGGSDRAAVRQFAQRLNQAKDLRDKSCRDIRQTLSIAYNDVQRLAEQLKYLNQHQLSISKAREAYRKQFDIGQRTLLDLLDTENEYFQARRAYVNGDYDHKVAEARTLGGMGKLLPSLQVAREDLPALSDLAKDREAVAPSAACPAEAPEPSAVLKLLGQAKPAAVAAPEPKAESVASDLADATAKWAAAWAAKDYDAYRAFYGKDFVPAEGQSIAAWEKQRRVRLAKQGNISVGVAELRVEKLGPDVAATVFRQTYRANDYQDVVAKRLEWARVDGKWTIQREIAE
ncbi:MAG: TolC family outer membrane protein [Denitromonas halophila]|nr:MAG: TolC family outer membrane protein [Denitromonas halophila]TVT73011.1 MAG: TolC family outer membrane protein [Denitromonas halophila]